MGEVFEIELEVTECDRLWEAQAFLRRKASTAQASNLGFTEKCSSCYKHSAVSYALVELATMIERETIKIPS